MSSTNDPDPIAGRISSAQVGRYARVALCAGILAYGCFLAGPELSKTSALTVALYALPLVAQFSSRPLLRINSIWLGIFLVAQAVATPFVLGDLADYVTLPPNLHMTVDFEPGAIPGIVGPQHISTDNRGFRAYPPVDYGKKVKLRVFAIGGSTTESIDLDDRTTWPYLLQEDLRRDLGRDVEVINTGVSGLRSQNYLATLSQILDYKPDIVVFLVGVNDWNYDIRHHFGSTTLPEFHHFSFAQTLLGRLGLGLYARMFPGAAVPSGVVKVGKAPPGYFRTGTEKNKNSLLRSKKIDYVPSAISSEYRSNLEAISDICRRRAFTCVFVTQPTAYAANAPDALKARFWMTPPQEDYTLTLGSMVRIAQLYNNALVQFATEHGHPVCDVASHMPPTFDDFFDDVHYNTKGSRRIAELVDACIAGIARGYLKPSGAAK